MAQVDQHVLDVLRAEVSDLRKKAATVMDRLTDEQLNWRPNADTNSVANLAVHLAGNLRQRIVSGLGGAPDLRNRDAEFDEKLHMTRDQVLAVWTPALDEAQRVLADLSADRLLAPQKVRNQDATVLALLVMVVTHLSEHVGQMVYIAKLQLGEGFQTLSVPKKKTST